MLSSAETIHVIAETLTAHDVPAIVLDPVCAWLLEFSFLQAVAQFTDEPWNRSWYRQVVRNYYQSLL